MSSHAYKIEIADEQAQPFDNEALIAVVEKILEDHGILQSEISIAVVDDQAIRQLNKRYLNHDYETDVISFVLEYAEETNSLSGQLVVSTDTAQRTASEFGASMQDELLLYVVHGTLHLLGFDDKQPSDAEEMRDAEKRYLEGFGVEHRWNDEPDDREVNS